MFARTSASRAALRCAALPVAALLLAGCRATRDFLPNSHTLSTSPDGRFTAFVRQGFNIDPPDDHLYLGDSRGRLRCLMHLAPDADWCRTIVWTRDSRLVGFLIRDQRLAVFDATTFEHVAMLPLVAADGYPGSEGARNVVFEDAGRLVTFQRFERASGRAVAEEQVVVTRTRLSLRMTWTGTNTPVPQAWVRVRLADGRVVDVLATPGGDGLVRLPAIAEGPFAFVEIGAPGSVRTTVLREVGIGPEPVGVGLSR
jgi:hypothetical protein